MLYTLLQTPSPIGGPSDWSQFGLIGLVVFALFMALFSFGGFVVTRFNRIEDSRSKQDDQRQEFLEKMLEQHVTERTEWKATMVQECREHSEQIRQITDRAAKAIDNNTVAFHDLQKQIAKNHPV